jgi:uncharacterized sulfatase
MTRRQLLAATAMSAAPAMPRNVLFIAVDDLNTHVGCYGAPVRTPNIDRLARQGVRFDRAYCQYPLCNPSRTSLLTGRRPPHTGVVENVTWFRDKLPDVVTLPQLFRHNGYRTMASGKIFHGGLNDDKAWDIGATPLARQTPRTGKAKQEREKHADRYLALDGDGRDEPDPRNTDRAIELLQQKHDKPFFLAYGLARPHVPFLAPRKFFDLYDPSKIRLPADFAADPDTAAPASRPNFDIFIRRPASEDEARRMIGGYYASISFMDAQLGRMLDALDKSGHRDNTTVVFFGDHGFHLGEKGMWSKMSLYEASTRVPLIVSAPGAGKPGQACGRTVELVDLYPTLADLCGLKTPPGIDGESLVPLLRDPGASWSNPAYSFIQRGAFKGASVRVERFRYTEWDGGAAGAELYDHQKDPGETRNLAADPQFAGERTWLKALLLRST